jgi:hypothetical protein
VRLSAGMTYTHFYIMHRKNVAPSFQLKIHFALLAQLFPRRVTVACTALCRRHSRRAAPRSSRRASTSLAPPWLYHPRAATPPPLSCRHARTAPPTSLAPPCLHLPHAAAPRLRLPRSASSTSRSVSVADSSALFLKRDGRKTQNRWRFKAPVRNV